jgi:signal transduction histidine kinase
VGATAFVSHKLPILLYTGAKLMTITLEHGHSHFTSFSYVGYGLLCVTILRDLPTGYQFGQLAMDLAEQFDNSVIRGQVNHVYGNFIHPWFHHHRESLKYCERAIHLGLDGGDLEYASYGMYWLVETAIIIGTPLAELYDMAKRYRNLIQQLNPFMYHYFFEPRVWQMMLNLLGQTRHSMTLDSDNFSEVTFLAGYQPPSQPYISMNFTKLIQLYRFGAYQEAKPWLAQAEMVMSIISSRTVELAEYAFYVGLLACALYETEAEQPHYLGIIRKQLALFEHWASHCEANFLHKKWLIEAEQARILGDDKAAMNLYDQAIASAKAHEYLNNEALANELAAKFWLTQDKPRFAALYLREAHYAYQRWGAVAKVQQLEELYPELRVQGGRSSSGETLSAATNRTGSHMLDLASVMKASQAISGEIKLAGLLEKMMRIVVENAGAERGLLILCNDDNNWLLQASYELGVMNEELKNRHHLVEVLQAIPIEATHEQEDNPKVSLAILRYVSRSQTALVLNDVRQEAQFAQTDYVKKCQPKSILCVPMMNQGVVMGFIYLENNLSTYTFTPERVEVVQLLGTQATISLHNVQTIALQAEQERLRIENELLGKLNADKDKFFSIVAHDLRGPFTPLLGNSELLMEMVEELSPQDIKEMSTSINRSARAAFGLLESLLMWARLQMGRMEYQPELVILRKIAQQTVDVLGAVAESKRIQLVNNVAPEVVVYADDNMSNTVIRNLTNNALKFTPIGGQVTISAQLGIRNEELGIKNEVTPHSQFLIPHYVEVWVADTGVGMSEEVRQKLFKLDQHVTTLGTGNEKGTGLGLIICQEMVEQGGGQIWVESELGRGTTVKFTVPLHQWDGAGLETAREAEVRWETETEEVVEWVLPAADQLHQFYQFATMGKMLALERAAHAMSTDDETLLPFAHHLIELARGFEDEKLIQLLRRYIS